MFSVANLVELAGTPIHRYPLMKIYLVCHQSLLLHYVGHLMRQD